MIHPIDLRYLHPPLSKRLDSLNEAGFQWQFQMAHNFSWVSNGDRHCINCGELRAFGENLLPPCANPAIINQKVYVVDPFFDVRNLSVSSMIQSTEFKDKIDEISECIALTIITIVY